MSVDGLPSRISPGLSGTDSQSVQGTGSLWTTSYQQKFRSLGSGLSSNLATRVWNGVRKYFAETRYADKLALGAYLGAEHLSNFVGGAYLNRSLYAFAHVANLLDEVDTQGNLSKQLREARSYREGFEKNVEQTAAKIYKKLSSLGDEESMIVPSSSRTHAMVLQITCNIDKETGKKTYKCVQHNEGSGIEDYHFRKTDENGKILYQTALEITAVSENELSISFFERLGKCRITVGSQPSHIYEILKELKGTISPPRDEPEFWSPGQLAGSCSARCLLSLARSKLPADKYDKFHEAAQYKLILRSVKQIRSGWGDVTAAKVIALDAIKQLEHVYHLREGELPEELRAIKANIERSTPAKES